MKQGKQLKYIIDKAVELTKFAGVMGFLCFMLLRAPGETTQIVGIAAAFILGGKIPKNLGL